MGNLDREEFQLLLVIGARHAVGTHQRTAVDLEADHGELPVLKAKAGIAGGPKAEQRVGPVLDRKNFLSIERTHAFCFPIDVRLGRIGFPPQMRQKPLINLNISTPHLRDLAPESSFAGAQANRTNACRPVAANGSK
jgi:hypothetical protein